MKTLLPCLLVLAGLATPALADGTLDRLLTAADKARLAALDQTLTEALAEARAGGSKADLAVLDQALAGQSLPIGDPLGTWSCRVIKLGGLLPLTVYPKFKCVWDEDDIGWHLAKTSGSQRTQGHFYDTSPTRLTYVGAGHVAGESPRRYGADPKENQVAVAERRAPGRIILMFPAPLYESRFDLLVLER